MGTKLYNVPFIVDVLLIYIFSSLQSTEFQQMVDRILVLIEFYLVVLRFLCPTYSLSQICTNVDFLIDFFRGKLARGWPKLVHLRMPNVRASQILSRLATVASV